MNKYIEDNEYIEIVKDILTNEEFNKLKDYRHHGENRRNHCIRVSYQCYRIAKALKMHYKELARGALLHDFFLVDYYETGKYNINMWNTHPKTALENSKKLFKLNKLEENIIESHMFPLGKKFPKYKESWMICIIDDFVSYYERIHYTLLRHKDDFIEYKETK